MKRSLRAGAALAVATLGLGPAGASPITTAGIPSLAAGAGDAGVLATLYQHRDCVGPGVPGTADEHATHTELATGFRIGGPQVTFTLVILSLFGDGICPTEVGGPFLEEDFTGTWHMTAVCRGTSNDGTVYVDWEVQAIAGIVTSEDSTATPCSGPAGSLFSVDITIAISDFGPVPALGGAMLTVTQ